MGESPSTQARLQDCVQFMRWRGCGCKYLSRTENLPRFLALPDFRSQDSNGTILVVKGFCRPLPAAVVVPCAAAPLRRRSENGHRHVDIMIRVTLDIWGLPSELPISGILSTSETAPATQSANLALGDSYVVTGPYTKDPPIRRRWFPHGRRCHKWPNRPCLRARPLSCSPSS